MPVALKLSLPPFMFSTIFSFVPRSSANGAGSRRSKRTRVPLAVTVKTSAPLPPLTWAVSMPAPPSNRSKVGAVARVPDEEVVAGFAEYLVVAAAARQRVVVRAAEQEVGSALAVEDVVADWPNSMSLPDPPVSVSLPAPPNSSAAGRAPFDSSRKMLSLPPWPKILIFLVLATVAVPPVMATAPSLTRLAGGVAADLDGVELGVAEHRQEAGAQEEGGDDSHCWSFRFAAAPILRRLWAGLVKCGSARGTLSSPRAAGGLRTLPSAPAEIPWKIL